MSGLAFTMTDDDYRDAERCWRLFVDDSLDPPDLAAEIDYWARQRDRFAADLAAQDFSLIPEAALRGGIAYAERRLVDLTRQANRYLRANAPARALPAREDLGPRFAAARYADLVGIAETLTGHAARKTGGGRYRIRCPFHDDHDPSLILYPPGRGWWCPVCGKGGDAVAFVAEHLRCSAVEALRMVEQLADTYPDAWRAA